MNMLKKCIECEIIKDIKEFSKRRCSKDGYRNKCKGCSKIYHKKYYKKYYEKNKYKIKECKNKYYEENKDKIKEHSKVYYEENKDNIKEYYKEYYKENKEKSKEYYEKNKDKKKEYSKVYRENNKELRLEYIRKRILNDPLYKLSKNMRSLIYHSLKNSGYTKDSKSNDILGCSYEELLDHLNDNKYGFIYGDDNLDIDHIIPLSRATSEEEIIELNHYSNLQLLPSWYNRHIKRDKDFDRDCLEEWLENKN